MWIIESCDQHVKKKFYLTFDACGLIAWSDDITHAINFSTKEEMVAFGIEHCLGEPVQIIEVPNGFGREEG